MRFYTYAKTEDKDIVLNTNVAIYDNLCIVFNEYDEFLARQELEVNEITKENALAMLENNELYNEQKKVLQDSKEYMIKLVNDEYEKAMKSLDNEASESERISYNEQEAQAKAYKQSGLPKDAPMLEQMAILREESLDELCDKVLYKANLFKVFAGKMLGKKQALIKRINECLFFKELELTKVDFDDK